MTFTYEEFSEQDKRRVGFEEARKLNLMGRRHSHWTVNRSENAFLVYADTSRESPHYEHFFFFKDGYIFSFFVEAISMRQSDGDFHASYVIKGWSECIQEHKPSKEQRDSVRPLIAEALKTYRKSSDFAKASAVSVTFE